MSNDLALAREIIGGLREAGKKGGGRSWLMQVDAKTRSGTPASREFGPRFRIIDTGDILEDIPDSEMGDRPFDCDRHDQCSVGNSEYEARVSRSTEVPQMFDSKRWLLRVEKDWHIETTLLL